MSMNCVTILMATISKVTWADRRLVEHLNSIHSGTFQGSHIVSVRDIVDSVKFRFCCSTTQFIREGTHLESPVFSTVYNNISLRWKLHILFSINGILITSVNNDGTPFRMCLRYVSGFQNVVTVGATYFISSSSGCELKDEKSETYQLANNEDSNGALFEHEGVSSENSDSESFLYVGVIIKISETEFDRCLFLEREGRSLPPSLSAKGLSFLFKDVVWNRTGVQPKKNTQEGSLDVKIKTNDGVTIFCHKIVLGGKNDVFQAMFSSQMTESQSKEVQAHYDFASMYEVVHFIYKEEPSTQFSNPDRSLLRNVLDAANAFQVFPLKHVCHEKLVERFRPFRAPEMLFLADRYDLKLLREISLNWISGKLATVRKTEQGEQLSQNKDLWMEVLETRQALANVAMLLDE